MIQTETLIAIAGSAILAVLTSIALSIWRRKHIKKRLETWADEDRARVDEINQQLGGRDG